LSGVVLIEILGHADFGGGSRVAYLEIIDVDVEASVSAFRERVGELFVGFAQNSMLGVLQ
jgi:hypothetical protein